MQIFEGLFRKPIVSKFEFLKFKSDNKPHRICFGNTHANALAPFYGPKPFKFSVPFSNSVRPVFENDTNLYLQQSQYGFWCPLTTQQKVVVETWIKQRKDIVFLRDYLDVSIALSFNSNGTVRTPIGELEYLAKYKQDTKAIEELISICSAFIQNTTNYKAAKLIAPIPPREGKAFDLPTILCSGIANKLRLEFITIGHWSKEKCQLKQLSVEQKWGALEGSQLEVNPKLQGKGPLILLDDLYQSGCTINFVANMLQHHCDLKVYGLSLVKSLGDSDNQS